MRLPWRLSAIPMGLPGRRPAKPPARLPVFWLGYASRMGYAIAIILVVLIVTLGVTFGVMRAARTRQDEGAATDHEAGDEMSIAAPDSDTPLGDTSQHAGEQTREGTTVGGQDADESGGTGEPVTSGAAAESGVGERGHRSADHHVPPVGGEQPAGEGEGTRPV